MLLEELTFWLMWEPILKHCPKNASKESEPKPLLRSSNNLPGIGQSYCIFCFDSTPMALFTTEKKQANY